MAKVTKTKTVELSLEDIVEIIKLHCEDVYDMGSNSSRVTINISPGDVGIKDPMDFSNYQPARIKNVFITEE